MAITKAAIVDKITVTERGVVQVRTATVVKEGTTELARNFHRHILEPRLKNDSGWYDPDISGEDARVQAVCNAVWTSDVKSDYETWNYGEDS